MSLSEKKVIIVGSGVAGLTAAFELQKKGFSVQVLEARSVHGGRIAKNDKFADFSIETGAEEIHLTTKYFELAKQVGGVCEPDNEVEHYIEDLPDKEDDISKGNGILIEREDYFQKYQREEFYENILEENEKQLLQDGMSILEYIKGKGEDQRFLKFYEFIWGTEYGSTLEEMSIKGFATHETGWESDHDINFVIRNMSHFDVLEKSYSSVLPLIKYNTPVQRVIIENQDNVKSGVLLVDANGNEYKADHVIITVPISQLKNGSITFNPPLPEEKQKAIELLQMGKGGKLHMRFKERFWPEKLGSLFLRCKIGMVWNCSYHRSEKDFVLCALISGQVAVDMNDEVKRKEMMKELFVKLQEVFKVEKNVEELFEDYIWTDYTTTKYIEGNYTYPALNLGSYREILAQPIGQQIFFAGEASNPTYFATINGALDTGSREAERIIAIYKQNE
ncbi:flavin containing family amine oxidase (macronuclear) [Tetrahymena thermophila SB210]|uniref:Flavin containing family amine oxidase n=1 Tax=Tetrahymena thermophila (strain SB210) TaxID=312017 RepID=I7LX27_TETTS|nr:flavin containing family amine oxidase [Tetrahymena thermophila SB210]EAS03643.1 flavin containing family amine oxidase [Tetrahymena thermophila SB210]|eukprot:XP_001023888.1 flavin containing family amine oxidase [Tetrahymena thermophila SB210]